MIKKYWKESLITLTFLVIVCIGVCCESSNLLYSDPFKSEPLNKEIILINYTTSSNDTIKIVHNTILGVDDTTNFDKVSIETYHNNLTDILKVLVANDGHQYANRENVKWQFRLFYAAIITGVALILFSRQKLRHSTYIITIAIICGMFVVELHLNDLSKQYFFVYTKEVNTLEFLSNIDKQDSVKYFLRREILEYELKLPTTGERIIRKYSKFFIPDIEQIILFTTPLFILLVLYTYNFRRLKKRKIF